VRKARIPLQSDLTIGTLAAFVDFLQNFKSASTEAAEQLEGLNINGGEDNDEYDMVDESDDPAPNETSRPPRSKAKYMDMLQDVVDRTRTNVLIDLNDLDVVRLEA